MATRRRESVLELARVIGLELMDGEATSDLMDRCVERCAERFAAELGESARGVDRAASDRVASELDGYKTQSEREALARLGALDKPAKSRRRRSRKSASAALAA